MESSAPIVKAFSLPEINLNGHQMVPVLVEARINHDDLSTLRSLAAPPKPVPTLKFSQWFDKVFSLNPHPIELQKSSKDNCFYSPILSNQPSYNLGLVSSNHFNDDKIELITSTYPIIKNDMEYDANFQTDKINISGINEISSNSSKISLEISQYSGDFPSLKIKSKTFEIRPGIPFIIGRQFIEDLFGNSDRAISRNHLVLLYRDGQLYIRDLSRYGTKGFGKNLNPDCFYPYDIKRPLFLGIGSNTFTIKMANEKTQ
jgi:hypothetical protein